MTTDNRSNTPATVERMTASSSRGGSSGLGGMLTILLTVACIVLIGACFFINNAKSEAQKALENAKTDLKDARDTLAAKDMNLQAQSQKIQQMAADLNRSIPLARLPEAVKAGTVGEALAKITQLTEAPQSQQAGRGAPLQPMPGNDSPMAWLETISRQVARGSINTREPVGNDAGKVQLHKGIQIVMTRVGAYTKPISGNPADTYDAVLSFQKANRLTADGIIGKGTWGRVREKFESTVAGVHQ
ncbi:MAG TPA: peptidoglycan-binding domain-containing protein [Phycisphaerales bacterium]|nr:peptidoglycan-binding domain-containing protein [Phycisphaerales bacterium]